MARLTKTDVWMPKILPITTLEIPAELAEKLKGLKIRTTLGLLERTKHLKQRERLAEELGIEQAEVLKLANLASLLVLRCVGPEYAFVLYDVVTTVRELGKRNPEHLLAAIKQSPVYRQRRVGVAPSLALVQGWVADAKELPELISYH